MLKGAHQAQCFDTVDIVCQHQVHQFHATGGDGAGLVENQRVNAARALQHINTFDNNAHLGGSSTTHHQRCRCRQAQSTRARDDQHRNGRTDRIRGRVTAPQPEGKCSYRYGHHRRYEHSAHAVGDALHRGLRGLGIAHQLGHRGELGLSTNARRFHQQATVQVHSRTHHRVTNMNIARCALARHHRRVDAAFAFDHHTISCDLLAWAHHNDIVDAHHTCGNHALFTVTQHHRFTSTKCEQ